MKEKYLTKENLQDAPNTILEGIKYKTPKSINGLSLDKTALIIIDMQNYFYLDTSHAQIPSINAIIDNIKTLTDIFPKENIYFTKHYNIPNSNDNMNRYWGRVLEKESAHFEIISELNTNKAAGIIEKQTYNAFYKTELDNLLKNKGIKHIVFCGVFAHLCVETSCREAFVRDYDVIVPVDAIADYNFEFHKATVRNLAHGFAYIASTKEIIELFSGEKKL